MKQMFAMLAVLALIIVGLGFYRGWFALSNTRDIDGHKVDVNLKVDEDKMKDDEEKVKEKARELTDQVKERIRP